MQTVDMLDRESFSEMMRLSHRELLVYARTLTREDVMSRDIVQDSYLAAWKSMEKFDVSRDFSTWMRGIVRNKWREALRKNKRLVALDDMMLESLEVEMLRWDEMRKDGGPSIFMKLEECVSKLSQSLLGAVRSYYYDGRNTDESAAALNIKGSAFRKRLERARELLRQCVEK